MLGKHYCWLVLLFLFEVDAPGYCQGLLVSLTMVIFVTHPVTVPLSLLAAERAESNGTSCKGATLKCRWGKAGPEFFYCLPFFSSPESKECLALLLPMPGPPQIYTKGHKDRQQGAEPCSSSQICPLPLPTNENFGKKHKRQGAYGHSLPIPTPLMMVSLPLIALDGIFFFLLLMLLCRFWKQMKLLSSTRSAGNKLHNSNTNWGAGWLV